MSETIPTESSQQTPVQRPEKDLAIIPPVDHSRVIHDQEQKNVSLNSRYRAKGFDTLYWWYLGLSLGGMLLTITIILAIFGLPVMIGAAVCAAIFLYRAWDQVQDSEARATPGLAVGLMFVPLFNLYWAYIPIWGLAKNLNSYTRRNNIEAPKVNEGLALGLCVMMSVGLVFMFVPILNIIAWLVTIPIALIVMNDFRKASMAIAASGA